MKTQNQINVKPSQHRYIFYEQLTFSAIECLLRHVFPLEISKTQSSNTMIRFRTLSVTLLASLLISASFGAIYIKIAGIEGDSKSAKHKGWIDVLSISGLSIPQDKASGLPTGKRQHKPLTITKRIDKATPLLAKAGGTSGNPSFPTRIAVEQNGVSYDLTGVKVTSSKKVADNEVLTLSYQSISKSTGSTRGIDYNSSRSNKTGRSARAAPKPPANHNTTRSK